MNQPPTLLLDGAQFETIRAAFQARAAAVDRGEADFRDAAPLAARLIHGEALQPPPGGPNADLPHIVRTLASIAWFDMATAFSLWCQRMVLEYLSHAPASSEIPARALLPVLRGERLGCTALAGPMAHYVAGAPLSLTAEATHHGYRINGYVPWASNLAAGCTIVVTAAASPEGPVVFATPIETPGLQIGEFQPLIAMQGTLSASLTFERVEVPRQWIISEQFPTFMAAVRPIFLLLQSAYCWGLAARSLTEARAGIRGVAEVFRDELDQGERRLNDLAATLAAAADCRCHGIAITTLLEARIEAAHLAVEAASLEARVAGGRSYIATCETARRLREALFLPVQAPTEGQLRWERSRFA